MPILQSPEGRCSPEPLACSYGASLWVSSRSTNSIGFFGVKIAPKCVRLWRTPTSRAYVADAFGSRAPSPSCNRWCRAHPVHGTTHAQGTRGDGLGCTIQSQGHLLSLLWQGVMAISVDLPALLVRGRGRPHPRVSESGMPLPTAGPDHKALESCIWPPD